ncbi:hypothetical protein B0T14DRAFT_428231 [Immersiella caudata]|uniref:TRI14-like protein n=1 Tax=Immersiella caudata TaxID=314043 RepID=A0AA40C4K1_9PEZI|nr:hypothetical protein B0T14DRAFT_428231 [Immersiella caudata]
MSLPAAAFAACFFFTIGAATRPGHRHCPPFPGGSFTIDRFQLYPENADFDSNRCVLYLSALFNSSVAIYDPYTAQITKTIDFPGLTGRADVHASGLTWDKRTGLLSIVLNSPNPFITGGQDISGDNFLVKYDPSTHRSLWTLNLTATTQGKYGGQQEVEHDTRGHTYVVGTYPSSILKVDKSGRKVTPWYLPPAPIVTTARGYSGLAATGDVLLANDNNGGNGGEIYRFDMREHTGRPRLVPRTPNVFLPATDAIYLPPKYHGKVLLVTINTVGIVVLRSKDKSWRTAEHLGTVANDLAFAGPGAIVPTAVQIGESIYMVELFFPGPIVPGTNAGDRSIFPMYDITAQVEALLV